MPTTDDLAELLDRLHTDTGLQNAYRANPVQATASFDLTGHERRAVVAKDVDDFVALGVVDNISELPEVIRGSREGIETWLDRLRRHLEKQLKDRLPRGPGPRRPDLPRPKPRPLPGPPGPRPGPRPRPPLPGPDPPGPDL